MYGGRGFFGGFRVCVSGKMGGRWCGKDRTVHLLSCRYDVGWILLSVVCFKRSVFLPKKVVGNVEGDWNGSY